MTDEITLFPGQTGNKAHYRGDVRESLMSQREPFGEDTAGALYTAVDATYDEAADVTTGYFRPIPVPQRRRGEALPEELPPMSRQQRRQYTRDIVKARKAKARKK